MHWFFLLFAILSEVSGTTSMKLSEGFTKLAPSIMAFVFYGITLASLTMALKKIDVSVVYATWSGLGIAIVSIIGVLWFKEPMNTAKLISLVVIALGVIGLNLSSGVQ